MIFRSAVFLIALSLSLLAQSLSAQDSGTGTPNGSLRVLFDSQGGFRLLRYSDGSYLNVLNPASANPVQLELYREDLVLPRSIRESKSTSPRIPAGAFPGPGFDFAGVRVDIFGVDLDKASRGTASIRYDFLNTTDSIQTFSMKLILDTYLGESGTSHFVDRSSGSDVPVSDERAITLSDKSHILLSASDNAKNGFALLLPPKKGMGSSPDKVILSNIRRIQNSGRNFDFEEGRIFNLVPFSVNDSAVALYYSNLTLLPNQSLSIDIIVSGDLDIADAGLTRAVTSLSTMKPGENSQNSTQTPQTSPTPQKSVDRAALLKRLNNVIEELNKLIDSGSYKTATIERMLEEINELRNALTGKS